MSETTTSALYPDGTTVYFNDLVREGDAVDVFRTEREAQAGEGWAPRMIVRRDGDVWWLAWAASSQGQEPS